MKSMISSLDSIYNGVNELVKEMPFDEIRIQDICARAGISPGTFYHYFSSKNDVLFDRYRRSNAFFRALYSERLVHMHAVDALKLLVEQMAVYAGTRLINILVPYYVALAENIVRWQHSDRQATSEILEKIIAQGMEKGEFNRNWDSEAIFSFMLISLNGMVGVHCIGRGTFLTSDAPVKTLQQMIEQFR